MCVRRLQRGGDGVRKRGREGGRVDKGNANLSSSETKGEGMSGRGGEM